MATRISRKSNKDVAMYEFQQIFKSKVWGFNFWLNYYFEAENKKIKKTNLQIFLKLKVNISLKVPSDHNA